MRDHFRLGLGQEVVDIESRLLADFYRPLVAHILVNGGIGLELGPIRRDLAKLEPPEFTGQLQNIAEAFADGIEVLAAELADRIVIGSKSIGNFIPMIWLIGRGGRISWSPMKMLWKKQARRVRHGLSFRRTLNAIGTCAFHKS